jgi:DNA-directed RNA polymerase beta subunit
MSAVSDAPAKDFGPLRPAWNLYDAFEHVPQKPDSRDGGGGGVGSGSVTPRLTMEERLARRMFLSFFAEKGLYAHLIESYDDMLRITLPHMMAEFGLIIIASERTQSLHIFCILPPTEIRKPQKREKLGYVTDLSLREARDRGLSYEGAIVTDVVHEVWKPRAGAAPIILPRKDGSTPQVPADPDSAPPAISTMRPLAGVRPLFSTHSGAAAAAAAAATGAVPETPSLRSGSLATPSLSLRDLGALRAPRSASLHPSGPSPSSSSAASSAAPPPAAPEITTQLLMAMAGLDAPEFFSGTSPMLDGILSPTAQWTMDESSSGIHARVGTGSVAGDSASLGPSDATSGCRPDPARFELASRTISRDTKLFTLPIMVGSSRCHTRDAPPAASDPWNRTEGYCVVNGMEKIFMPQLNPTANRILVHAPQMRNETQVVTGEMRCRHWAKIRSTATIYVDISSSYRGTGMVTASMRGIVGIERAIPLFALCRMIGFRTIEGTARVMARRGTVVEGAAGPASGEPVSEPHRFELWLQSMLRNRGKGDPDFEAMTADDIMLWVGDNCLAKRSTSTIAAALAANCSTAQPAVAGTGGAGSGSATVPISAPASASPAAMRKSTQHYLCNEFMPHVGMEMSELTLRNKRALLAFMVWRICKVVRQELPHDERDHFGNQMIETPGRLTMLLFRQLYRNALMKRTVRTLKLNADTGRHFSPADCIPSRRLSQDMGYAMSTGSWGVHKGGSARKGIMQVLKRINPLATMSNLRSCRKPGELKDMAPRLLGVHDWGIACPSETTEGENCGLLKHLAAHAYVTQGRPTRTLAELLIMLLGKDLVCVAELGAAGAPSLCNCPSLGATPSGEHSVLPINACTAKGSSELASGGVQQPFPTVLLVNGILLGVIGGAPAVAVERLREARRRRVLPFDAEISFNARRGELHVSAENGAVRRPLLVVFRGDPERTAARLRDVARLCESHEDAGAELFRDLLRRGFVEFVGKNEEEELVVRASPFDSGEADFRGPATEDALQELALLASTLAGESGGNGASGAELIRRDRELRERLTAAGITGDDAESALRAMRESYLRGIVEAGAWSSAGAGSQGLASAKREVAARPGEREARSRLVSEGDPQRDAGLGQSPSLGSAFHHSRLPAEALLQQPYTHYELHPAAIHSLTTGLIPFSNHNQAPRNTYQCAMGKAAIGEPQEVDESRAYQRLPEAQIPLACTQQEWMLNPRYMRSGVNVVVAILCKDGNNQEDSLNMCSADFQLGLYRSWEYVVYSDTAAVTSRGDPQAFERPGDDVWGKRDCDYSLLGEHGFAEPGTIVVGGAAVIGKTVKVPSGRKRDQSTLAGEGEAPGTVVSVVEAESRDRRRLKVQVARPAVPIIGDKFSARHGQKGVIGDKLPREDMPWGVLPMQIRDARGRVTGMRFTEVRPNILMNPNAIPSRMTIGQLLGVVAGTAAAAGGYVADATAFAGGPATVDELRDELKRLGLDPKGTVRLRSGVTGEELANAEVFIGVDYWQRLKQEAAKKMRAVDQGDRSAITRQPMEGKRGGLRAGEMERDAFIAHGAREIVTNTFLDRSDDYVAYACTACGMLACPPRAPDPRMTHLTSLRDHAGFCTYCRSADNVARFRTPYALKLMIQELTALGIVPRLNIDTSESILFANAPAAGVPAAADSLPRSEANGREAGASGSAIAPDAPLPRSESLGPPSAQLLPGRGGVALRSPSSGNPADAVALRARRPSIPTEPRLSSVPRSSRPGAGRERSTREGAAAVANLPGGVRVRGPDIVEQRDREQLMCEAWEGGAYG